MIMKTVSFAVITKKEKVKTFVDI